MEVMPGVFVSSVTTDVWSPDPEVPGTEMHVRVHDGTVSAGLMRIASVDGPLDWTPEQREIIHVLEGAGSSSPTARRSSSSPATSPRSRQEPRCAGT